MTAPAISARLKYLTNSAHLMTTDAPSTSAYLMARCNSLMFDNELIQSENQRRHVCGACGNIMILGCTGARHIESLKAQKGRHSMRSKLQQLPSARIKTVVYTCERCSRRTRQSIDTSASRPLKNAYSEHHLQPSQAAISLEATSPDKQPVTMAPSSSSANASSRKRAKIRKQVGLQALLAKQKDTNTSGSNGGFGLDLLDLMKKA